MADDNELQQLLEELEGHLHTTEMTAAVLMVAVRALVATHPNPERFLGTFRLMMGEIQVRMSKGSTGTLPDAAREAAQEVLAAAHDPSEDGPPSR